MWYYRYQLVSKDSLNAKSVQRIHEGCLLRSEEGGVACLHPWPSLGDPSLDQLLDGLARGREHPMLQSAKHCMEIDSEARKQNVSLFDQLSVPLSHATITGGVEQVHQAVSKGFGCVKIKLGKKGAQQQKEFLEHVHNEYPQLQLRLDWNQSQSAQDCATWLSALPSSLRQMIDFVEDPYLSEDHDWSLVREMSAVEVALDREASLGLDHYDVLVIKPAMASPEALVEEASQRLRRVVFTSMMDHPIGQNYAAWCAGNINESYHGVVDVCGLMTHELYEPTAFSQELGAVSPEWNYAQGSGLGFDDLLEQIEWKRF